MVVRWVSKNDIEGLNRFLQIPENICPDYAYLINFHGSDGFLDKLIMGGCHFNGNYGSCTPGGKFIGDASSTGEQVQNIHLLNVVLVDKDIKKTLFGEIGGGPGLEICWWMDLLPPEYAAYYPHLLLSERIILRRISSLLRCSR